MKKPSQSLGVIRALLLPTSLFFGVTLLAADIKPGIVGTNIIVVLPEGFGQRYRIPFRASLRSGGVRRWEVISEPFYARGEDTTALQDVNLFSLCNIKMVAERPDQDPAHLTVDFTQFNIPPQIKISREEIVSSLFYCIIYTSFAEPPTKPIISVVTSPEHKAMVDRAKTDYDKDDFGHRGEKTLGTPTK
ncbi:MAG: hypothetical protein ABI680_00505 [Chthoniobacteraceae bacterium]